MAASVPVARREAVADSRGLAASAVTLTPILGFPL
jgi:hypothetical protein